MKVLLFIFAGIALGWCDKLDRTYLPPPGSKLSGGSAGDIQTPLEFPKEPPFSESSGHLLNQVPTGPSNGFGTNQQNQQAFRQLGLGQDLIPLSPFVPSQQAPQNNFQGNLNLPTTTTSYAFTQTTTYAPDFESVTGSPGSFLDSQRISQQFPNFNIPGQTSYPLGSENPNQGSANDQQGPSYSQGRLTNGPKPQDSQFLNPNFINNNVAQSNPGFVPSLTPSFSQYENQKIVQSQQYLNPIIPSGSQSGFSNQVQLSALSNIETSQSPISNQNKGSFNNVQPSGVPNYPTSPTPIEKQYQNVGPSKNFQPSAAPGFNTPQRPIQNNQYQSFGPNQPIFENTQNRFSPTGAPVSNSNVAILNSPAYSQLGSRNPNENVANVEDFQRYNPNIPSASFDQVSSTRSPINFASSTASTLSPEIYSSSTPIYPSGKIEQQSVPSNLPERIQADANRNAYILNYENIITPEQFSYSFDTSNGIHADESGTATDGVKATGGYSYTGDDGKVYSVVYTADEKGFLPRGDHFPTPPPIPEAILRVIEQASRDKEAGVTPDDGSYNPEKYGDKKYQGATGTEEQYKPRMERMLSNNRTATLQGGNDFPISRKGSLQNNKEYNDQTKVEKADFQDGTAADDNDIEKVTNVDTIRQPKIPTSDELKPTYNRKQEKSMRKSSEKPSRPKYDTGDDLDDDDYLETSVTSKRIPSKNQFTKASQGIQQEVNQYEKSGIKDQRRPSSKNSNMRNQVPLSSNTTQYAEEDSKFNGNPYLPDSSTQSGLKYKSNERDDSYNKTDFENPDEEKDSHEGKQGTHPVNEMRMNISLQSNFNNNNQRPRIFPQKPVANRGRPSNEELNGNGRTMDREYQEESLTPTSENKKERNKFNQRNQPSQKQPAYSTRRTVDSNRGQSGYEYNPPQKPFSQNIPNHPSIFITQKGGAQSSSGPNVPASISNEYDQNKLTNDRQFQTTNSPQNRFKSQRTTSSPITTVYPNFEEESLENEDIMDNFPGANSSVDDFSPETKIQSQVAYETKTIRRPTFGTKMHSNTVPTQYKQKFPGIGNNIYNNQVNSQTPTQGQTEGNGLIYSTTPLPRRSSTFGLPTTPQRASQHNQYNKNLYSTASKPFASNNQHYHPDRDSNITLISVLRPTYLPAATNPKYSSRVNGFGRPALLQPTFGTVPSTTYGPNYSSNDNVTTGSTPEGGIDKSTRPKYNGEFVAPSLFDVKQPSGTFLSESPKGITRPGFSSDHNIISPTTKPTYQSGFEESYEPNAPGVTPGVTSGPSYGLYPSTNGVIPTTEKDQYQGFQQQQQPTSVPTLGDHQGNPQHGSNTLRPGYGPTPDFQTKDGAINQQNYQPPVTGQMFGLNQGLQTNIGSTSTNGPFQGTNMGAGEDFSGPKQTQYFDPETGYHY